MEKRFVKDPKIPCFILDKKHPEDSFAVYFSNTSIGKEKMEEVRQVVCDKLNEGGV